MQLAWGAALTGLIVLGATGIADAAGSVSVGNKTYAVSGKTGAAMLSSMNRRGPKHGFLSRAIAQTQYRVDWDVKFKIKNGSCVVARAHPRMKILYTFPEPSDAISPDLRKRWKVFMVGVRKHEEQHGRFARQMLAAAERSAYGVKVPGDATCRKTGAEIKRRVASVYEEYEAKQIVFDRREHKQNGNIHRLIKVLTKD